MTANCHALAKCGGCRSDLEHPSRSRSDLCLQPKAAERGGSPRDQERRGSGFEALSGQPFYPHVRRRDAVASRRPWGSGHVPLSQQDLEPGELGTDLLGELGQALPLARNEDVVPADALGRRGRARAEVMGLDLLARGEQRPILHRFASQTSGSSSRLVCPQGFQGIRDAEDQTWKRD